MPPPAHWHRDIRFEGPARAAAAITEVQTHESVCGWTHGHEDLVRILSRRGYSTHLAIGPGGEVVQLAELDDRLVHAGGHNGPSIGIDLVTYYYPVGGKAQRPWSRVIAAPWADDGADQVRDYVLPTLAQIEAFVEVLQWLVEASGLAIPWAWPGVIGGRMRMGLLPDGGQVRRPGIWAHHYSNHADGAWPVLAAWLAIEGRRSVPDAYEIAAELATSARGWVTLPAPSTAPTPATCPTCGAVRAA